MANRHSVTDNGDLRKYYAAIPNIVFKLGLNPYELALYVYLKQVAGEDRACWKSTATIAKEIGMGAGTVSKIKTSLAAPRAEIGNKPLIMITTEMQNGGNANHVITITDIWPENMAELSRVREAKATRSRDERARSGDEGTRSAGGDKEEPLNKNPEESSGVDFLSELKTKPLYARLDLDVELARAEVWAEAHHKRVTKRFFINWLGRGLDNLPLSSNGSSRPVWMAAAK
jgi:hypothetical protein